jgi:hypothetical protein
LFVDWSTDGERIQKQARCYSVASVLATSRHRSAVMQQVAIAFLAFNLVGQSEQTLSDLAQFARAMVSRSVGSWLCHRNG